MNIGWKIKLDNMVIFLQFYEGAKGKFAYKPFTISKTKQIVKKNTEGYMLYLKSGC